MAKKVINSVFNYTSVCCQEPANKPPCERAKDDRKEGKPSQSPLGTWKCTRCKKTCKVTRSLRKVEVREVTQEAA